MVQLFPMGNAKLLTNQIDARQLFCHRMLHLDARIHFHEIKILVLIEQKFDSPGRIIFGRFHNIDGRLADFFPQFMALKQDLEPLQSVFGVAAGSCNRAPLRWI